MSYALPFAPQDSQPLAATGPDANARKLLGLELLRFAAALSVLLNHYRFFAQMAGMPATKWSTFPFYSILWPFYNYGHFGVEVFWGISGYIFFWKYGLAIRSGAVAARNFFWLRFSRLYPLHLTTLVIVTTLQAMHRQTAGADFIYPAQDMGLFLRHLLLASDWTTITFSFNGPIWSVSAEIAVYAAFFLLLRRFNPSLKLCITAVIAGLGLTLAGIGWTMILCAIFFFAGGTAALAPAGAGRLALPALLALLLVCSLTHTLADEDKWPMILLLSVPCLLIIMSRDWQWMERWQRPIRFLGNLTYSSYLLHFPLQLLLAIGVAKSGIIPSVTSTGFFAFWLIVTLGVAALSYRRFEMPIQAWIRGRTVKARLVL